MDTPPKPSSLPSIRTFAKDLEKKKQATTPSTTEPAVTPSAKPVPEATVASDAGEAYRAPVATKRVTGKINAPEPKAAPKEIPKKIPEPTLKPLSAPKAASEPTIIVDNEDAATATIIRDTKHNRFRLFPAIGSSLKSWLQELKEKYFTKKAPKYTVPDTTLRKGVIQKATSKTGKIATFDHTSLQERIRERKDRAVPKMPTTTWTPNTEPGYPLLESPDTILNVQVEPRRSFRSVTPPAPAEAPQPTPAPAPVVTIPTPDVAAEPTVVLPAPIIEEPVVTPPPAPTPQPQPARITTPIPNVRLRDWLFSLNTNLMSLGVAGLIIAVIVTSAAGYLWFKNQTPTILPVLSTEHPTLLSFPLTTVLSSDITYEAVYATLVETLSANEGVATEIAIAASPDQTVLVPVPVLFETLGFRVSGVFSRSVSELRFGELTSGTPFIVMKATDTTTARGGLLSWEATLFEDTTRILNHQNGGRVLPTTASFTDQLIAGTDTRVLATPSGEEYLVYTLTKENLIIITTSQAALTELLTITN